MGETNARDVARTLGDRAGARQVGAASHAPREATVGDLLRTVAEFRGTAALVLAAALAAAGAYVVLAPRLYETSLLVQVEREVDTAPGMDDVGTLFRARTPAEGEELILRSNRLLDAVVAANGLDVVAEPRRLPVVGDALARRHRGADPAPARLGLERFAFGGEEIRVAQLDVSSALEGEPLVLTALGGDRFRLSTRGGPGLLEGEVGAPSTWTDGERSVGILVAKLVARPGTEFTVQKLARPEAVERLAAALEVVDQGRGTGLVKLTLTGHDPVRTAARLDELAAIYLRQNVERTSAEAAKMLKVLDAQLPALRRNLEQAEVAFNRYRAGTGAVNLSVEGEALLVRAGELDRALAEVELRLSELAKRTTRHPDTAALERRAAVLRQQREELERSMRQLPGRELQSARLARQVRVATELYMLVMNRAEELRIVTSGWIGNVRILEQAAVPHRPASPRPVPILALAALLGIAGAFGAAALRSQLRSGVHHLEDIEAGTGLPVLATVVQSRGQRALGRHRKRGKVFALAEVDSQDAALEDLRALRGGLEVALPRARNRVVAIGGLAPGAGKSFVSVNLAHLLAATGGRILLVDADLRRGALHRYFGLEAQPGLAEVAAGAVPAEDAIRRTGNPNLDVLTAGKLAGAPSDLLAAATVERLLTEAARRYAAVIVDTPPFLAVNDGAIVGRHAGVNLVVVRAGQQSLGEIEYAARLMRNQGMDVLGIVLNGVPRSRDPNRYRLRGKAT